MPKYYACTVWIPYDKDGKWKFLLVREFKNCDFDVDANKLI